MALETVRSVYVYRLIESLSPHGSAPQRGAEMDTGSNCDLQRRFSYYSRRSSLLLSEALITKEGYQVSMALRDVMYIAGCGFER